MKKKCLITGATGFMGANVVRRLLTENFELHVLVRRESNLWRIREILDKLIIHRADLQDSETIQKVVSRIKPNIILHLAAYGAYPFQQDVWQMFQTNIIGTFNLVNACTKTGFDIFVNTGTSSEYGFKPSAHKETDWLEPNSYYAVTKASSTMYCSYTSKATRLPVVTLRLYSVYGPYEESSRLIPTLIRLGIHGKLPKLVSPDTARDYIFVDDVVNAYLAVIANNNLKLGEVYNVGTGVQTTLREIIAIVRQMLDIKVEPEWNTMPGRIWDTIVWVADNLKIRTELGWQPQYNLRTGLKETIKWFRKNRHFYPTET